MTKGKHIIGKTIITLDTGEIIDKVQDVIFDSQNNKIMAFLVDEGGMMKSARVLPFENAKRIGEDSITVESINAVVSAERVRSIQEFVASNNILIGTKVMTEDGKNLGKINDVVFNEITGMIEGYEVTGGMFADAVSGSSFLPSPKTINIGRDVAFVPSNVITLMDNQEGGLKQMFQTTKDKVTSGTRNMTDSISSGWKNSDTFEGSGDRMRDGAQDIKSQASDAWMRIKEKATHMREKLSSEREDQQIKGAVGRPVTRVILDKDDNVILKTGEIITHESVEKARHSNVLDVLVSSVYKSDPNFSSDELKQRGSKDSFEEDSAY
ncbi:MAG: PRC-barrel domain-containing protein [bacterium]|nr:PRC-barrel domain-containing protein [bacterium]